MRKRSKRELRAIHAKKSIDGMSTKRHMKLVREQRKQQRAIPKKYR